VALVDGDGERSVTVHVLRVDFSTCVVYCIVTVIFINIVFVVVVVVVIIVIVVAVVVIVLIVVIIIIICCLSHQNGSMTV
jgi:hypothetical protein